jgi:hypothetical protein
MESGLRGFEDYVYEGMDSFLKLTAKAGESIRSASDHAIERIDLSRLENRLSGFYRELGEISYRRMADGLVLDASDPEVAHIVEAIAKVSESIAARKAGGPERTENDTNGEKKENDY